MIRILIIEDEPLIRIGIRTAISEDSTMQICGEAESGEQGLKLVQETHPDIVLLDIGLPDVSGLDLIPVIKEQFDTKVIIITSNTQKYTINSALTFGADSYLLKQDVDIMKYAIQRTFKGENFLDPKITKQVLQKNSQNRGLRKGKLYEQELTTTEIEILKLIGRGLSNREIANKLFVTTNTAKSHVNSIFTKLNTKNRVQAVTRGEELGYLQVRNLEAFLLEVI
ncbi:response regulator [Nostoc sp. CCY0012]|uniref:response regulator n=1 Tax=Nostoc sp. CCY0012 TaxID=1056123 RepID=UPI0039C5E659